MLLFFSAKRAHSISRALAINFLCVLGSDGEKRESVQSVKKKKLTRWVILTQPVEHPPPTAILQHPPTHLSLYGEEVIRQSLHLGLLGREARHSHSSAGALSSLYMMRRKQCSDR